MYVFFIFHVTKKKYTKVKKECFLIGLILCFFDQFRSYEVVNWFIWIFKVDGKILFWFQILWPNFLTFFLWQESRPTDDCDVYFF